MRKKRKTSTKVLLQKMGKLSLPEQAQMIHNDAPDRVGAYGTYVVKYHRGGEVIGWKVEISTRERGEKLTSKVHPTPVQAYADLILAVTG